MNLPVIIKMPEPSNQPGKPLPEWGRREEPHAWAGNLEVYGPAEPIKEGTETLSGRISNGGPTAGFCRCFPSTRPPVASAPGPRAFGGFIAVGGLGPSPQLSLVTRFPRR